MITFQHPCQLQPSTVCLFKSHRNYLILIFQPWCISKKEQHSKTGEIWLLYLRTQNRCFVSDCYARGAPTHDILTYIENLQRIPGIPADQVVLVYGWPINHLERFIEHFRENSKQEVPDTLLHAENMLKTMTGFDGLAILPSHAPGETHVFHTLTIATSLKAVKLQWDEFKEIAATLKCKPTDADWRVCLMNKETLSSLLETN